MAGDKQFSLSEPRTLLIGLVLIALTGLSVLLLWPSPCGGIFEQTAPHLRVNLKIIENEGAFAVSREKIQDLSESAQKVGMHLKTCCSVLDAGNLDSSQFQECIDRAAGYGKKIALVAQQVTEAAKAKEKGSTEPLQERINSINQAIETATGEAENFTRQAIIAPNEKINGDRGKASGVQDELPPVAGGYTNVKLTISEYGGSGIRYKIYVNGALVGIYESNKTYILDPWLKPAKRNTVSWEFEAAQYGPTLYIDAKYRDIDAEWARVYEFIAREDRLVGSVGFSYAAAHQ